MSKFLEWAVITLPTIAGLAAWVFPIEHPRRTHRLALLVACMALSALIWWQQLSERRERDAQSRKLPAQIASEVVKILPKGLTPSTSRWGLADTRLGLLAERVAPFAPAKERGDLITCSLGNPDSTRFAAGLSVAFRRAGWKIPGIGYNQAVYSGPLEGIWVKVRSPNDRIPALDEFVTILRESGIEPKGQIDESIPSGDFRIDIGARPED